MRTDDDHIPFFHRDTEPREQHLADALGSSPFSRRRRARPAYLPLLKMTQGAYHQMMAALAERPPEAAGILLGPKDDEPLATHFVLDASGVATTVSFQLDVEHLNEILCQCRQFDLTCVGIVHSHPTGICGPSHGDLIYVERVLGHEANGNAGVFLFPIFCDGRLHPYILCRTDSLPQVAPAALVLI